MLTQDDIEIYTSRREFLSLEKMDYTILGSSILRAYFTIGVIIEISAVRESKNGKPYAFMKISDLVKYDIMRAKKMIEAKFKEDDVLRKQLERNFTQNGYKTLKIMAFGEAASAVSKF